MITLSAYLDEVMDQEWSWGRQDCCFFAGNWIAAATGRDPLGPYRGAYDGALGAARLIAARGGLVTMVDVEMERCEFRRVDVPDDGDIGVVAMEVPDSAIESRMAVVIRTGPWWVGKVGLGITGVQCDSVAAWRVL